MRQLEDRYGVALLVRTTRHVAMTAAGEGLFAAVQPALRSIDEQLDYLEMWRDRPVGRLRLTMSRMAAVSIVGPVLRTYQNSCPEVELEIHADERCLDLVEERFDAGIWSDCEIDEGMVSVPVGSRDKAVIVGSADYLGRAVAPSVPDELSRHRCILYRLPNDGLPYTWHLEKNGEAWDIVVNGGPVFNDSSLIELAALQGCGLAYLYENQVADHLSSGRLTRVLADYDASFPGYSVFYPSRRHVRPALRRFVEILTASAKAKAKI